MSKKQNKRNRSARYISKFADILKCPLCAEQMKVHDLSSLVCTKNHTFDISRQGYLNLMTRQIQSNYTKKLFEARREVIADSGLFERFHEQISHMIHTQTPYNNDISIVDMGSGEGSHLNNIGSKLHSQFNKTVTKTGLDISKEGILIAAQNYENTIWLVADIKSSPLNNSKFDVILSILSPANYEEFSRLLTKDGIVIKASPGKDYLKELRDFFHKESDNKSYSNEKIIDHFQSNFHLVDHEIIHYKMPVSKSTMNDLIEMTPLTWGVSDKDIQHFLEGGHTEVTIDFDILIGKNS